MRNIYNFCEFVRFSIRTSQSSRTHLEDSKYIKISIRFLVLREIWQKTSDDVANTAKMPHKFTAFLEAILHGFSPFLFQAAEHFLCKHNPCFIFLIGLAGNQQVSAKFWHCYLDPAWSVGKYRPGAAGAWSAGIFRQVTCRDLRMTHTHGVP
jgi:hypothetical protein